MVDLLSSSTWCCSKSYYPSVGHIIIIYLLNSTLHRYSIHDYFAAVPTGYVSVFLRILLGVLCSRQMLLRTYCYCYIVSYNTRHTHTTNVKMLNINVWKRFACGSEFFDPSENDKKALTLRTERYTHAPAGRRVSWSGRRGPRETGEHVRFRPHSGETWVQKRQRHDGDNDNEIIIMNCTTTMIIIKYINNITLYTYNNTTQYIPTIS